MRVRQVLAALLVTVATAGAVSAGDPVPLPVAALPAGLPAPPRSPADTPAAVEYGEFLYRSPLLASDESLSCGSCHVARLGFSGDRPLAVGIGGAVGPRRVPPLFNLAGAARLMWDGRAAGLDDQVHIPIETPTEMNIDWPGALAKLAPLAETRAYLTASGRRQIDRAAVLGAVAAYARTLVSGGSRFDRYYYLNDEGAISDEAKAGLRVFVRKARCSSCHLLSGWSAPLTDNNFHSIGIGWSDGKYLDDGRFAVTGAPADRGAFKTPTLRNVALRPYFMHDGSMTSLRQVIEYYNQGGNSGAANFDKRLTKLFLTREDVDNLLAFLATLNAPVVSYRPWLAGGAAR